MDEAQEWLNEELVRKLLKISIEEDVKEVKTNDGTDTTEDCIKNVTVVDYKAKRAVEDGKNYSSIIYRVNISYKHDKNELKEIQYIVKKLMPSVKVYFGNKEDETLQAVEKIQQYINNKLVPKLYLHIDDLLVMEDLNAQGFRNTVLKLLDYNHSVAALKTLAKFHAGSVLFHRNYPKLVEENIGHDVVLENPEFDILDYFQKIVRNFGEEISNWPESRNYSASMFYIAEKLKWYFENIRKRNTLKVLNHGDYWLNNLLFRYDSDKICDVRMVDFQICRYAPPSCDFQYFIGTSCDFDVRQNRLDELITVYLHTFNSQLSDLGIAQSITREQFEDNLKEDYYMYFAGMSNLLGILLADPLDAGIHQGPEQNLEQETNNLSCRLMKSKEFRKFVPLVLEDLDKKGIFESFRD